MQQLESEMCLFETAYFTLLRNTLILKFPLVSLIKPIQMTHYC